MQQMNEDGMNMEMAGASISAGKKESKGMMIGMIMCSVLAVAGIGFGVHEMAQANSVKQQASEIKEESKKTFSEFAKNIQASADSRTNFSINSAHLAGESLSGPSSAYDWGSVHVDADNHLKIIADQTKSTVFEAENVLLAFYVEHDIVAEPDENGLRRHLGIEQYVYYTDLSGEVYRAKIDASLDELNAEHLEDYHQIAFVQNTSMGAVLIDYRGNSYSISDF